MNCMAFQVLLLRHYSAAVALHPHPSACLRPGTNSSAAALASVHPENKATRLVHGFFEQFTSTYHQIRVHVRHTRSPDQHRSATTIRSTRCTVRIWVVVVVIGRRTDMRRMAHVMKAMRSWLRLLLLLLVMIWSIGTAARTTLDITTGTGAIRWHVPRSSSTGVKVRIRLVQSTTGLGRRVAGSGPTRRSHNSTGNVVVAKFVGRVLKGQEKEKS